VRTGRHWHDGVAALGLFITWLCHAGPQASGADVVVGGQVLADPGTEPARGARRINGVLTAARGFVAHAVTSVRLTLIGYRRASVCVFCRSLS
jgi:integrase/recombinase XerD